MAGMLHVREGYAEFRGYMTWFRVTGELKAKKPPVVILHGGPGAAHDYTDGFKLLAATGQVSAAEARREVAKLRRDVQELRAGLPGAG